MGGLRSARQVLVRFPNPDQAGTPGICQVPQPILGRHARYAPGVKIGKSSSTLKPTHMLVAIHGANQWSDLNPWYGRTQSRVVIAMCFTVETHMDSRNATLHQDFEKIFFVCIGPSTVTKTRSPFIQTSLKSNGPSFII